MTPEAALAEHLKLLEMPHTEAPDGTFFDPGWEKAQAPGKYGELHAQMSQVFAGMPVKGAHDSAIHLPSREHRRQYLAHLSEHPSALNILAGHLIPGFKQMSAAGKEAARAAAFAKFHGEMSGIIDSTPDYHPVKTTEALKFHMRYSRAEITRASKWLEKHGGSRVHQTLHGIGSGDFWFIPVRGQQVRLSLMPGESSVAVLGRAIRLLGSNEKIADILGNKGLGEAP